MVHGTWVEACIGGGVMVLGYQLSDGMAWAAICLISRAHNLRAMFSYFSLGVASVYLPLHHSKSCLLVDFNRRE